MMILRIFVHEQWKEGMPKIREIYKTKLFPKKDVKFLVQQIDIRWGCKYEAVDLLADKLSLFLDTLMIVSRVLSQDDLW